MVIKRIPVNNHARPQPMALISFIQYFWTSENNVIHSWFFFFFLFVLFIWKWISFDFLFLQDLFHHTNHSILNLLKLTLRIHRKPDFFFCISCLKESVTSLFVFWLQLLCISIRHVRFKPLWISLSGYGFIIVNFSGFIAFDKHRLKLNWNHFLVI